MAVFATEPVPSEAAYRRIHGFTDRDALKSVLAALSAHAEWARCRWRLVVKLHPIDRRERVASVLKALPASRRVRCELQRGDRLSLLRKAAVVFGTRSMLLLEAALLGLPTISVQPQRKTTSDLTDHHRGIAVVTQSDVPLRVIANALRRGGARSSAHPSSCRRFLRLLQPFLKR